MIAAAVDRFPAFIPWIGGEYRRRDLRLAAGDLFDHCNNFIHVMGESHYSDDYPVSSDLTTRVICDWALTRQRGGAFFTKVLQAIQGRDADAVDRINGWAGIAFSNYIQELLNASRQAPSAQQWKFATRCFVGQLAITRPRVLLVLGERLWQQLPADFGERLEPAIAPNGSLLKDAWVYPYWIGEGLHVTLAVHCYHPSSSRFDAQAAHRAMTAADMFYDNVLWSVREEFAGQQPVRRIPDMPVLGSA